MRTHARPMIERLRLKLPVSAPKGGCRGGTIPKQRIAALLPEAPVVVEAGAHVGTDTVEMSGLWPEGTIHAFEPVPRLYDQLSRHTAACANVRTYALGLADHVGDAEMFISGGASDGSSSLLPPKDHLTEHPDVVFPHKLSVPVTTLDAWVVDNLVDRVDLLWLDVQGYELKALESSLKVLQSVQVIHVEVSLKEVYQGVPLYPELRKWLEDQGFRVDVEALPWRDMGNVLFSRPAAKV